MKNQLTQNIVNDEFDTVFVYKINSICKYIELSGFDPYSQLTGYLQTNDARYITRTGNARDTIRSLDRDKLLAYVNKYLKPKYKNGG